MTKQTVIATDFDDDELELKTRPNAIPAAGKDEDGVPYCVRHHCRMVQTSGGKAGSPVAYHKCPVDGCEEKAKRIKGARPVIPAEPLLCPRCAGITPRPVMERDPKTSTAMYTILKCLCCGHKSAPMPHPDFVANHAKARRGVPTEELGAR